MNWTSLAAAEADGYAGTALFVSAVSLTVAILSLAWNVVSVLRSGHRLKIRITPAWHVDGGTSGVEHRGLGPQRFPTVLGTDGKTARAAYVVAA
ncbi:hypothetical protein AB0G02_27965 [Actinosynnema sp. NPDC023658]|uniref:hypothetical protein n=1 Tax=Actinosynnema sp. NPDC023658 TaxID=3155465 RepID=UPI00340FA01B